MPFGNPSCPFAKASQCARVDYPRVVNIPCGSYVKLPLRPCLAAISPNHLGSKYQVQEVFDF